MDYLLYILFATWFISQSTKFILSLRKKKPKQIRKHAVHIFLFASGPPSTHAAVLTASILAVGRLDHWSSNALFVFLFFGIFWIYEIYLQCKRIDLLTYQLRNKIKLDERSLIDFHGHSVTDIAAGVLIGFVSFILLNELLWVIISP